MVKFNQENLFLGIEMRGIDGIGNWILIAMATASLISMIAAISLENLVSQNLYAYGLQFNYGWAIPYWNIIGVIFATAWVNIIATIAFQIYRIRTIRKEEKQSINEQSENTLELTDEQKRADSADQNTKSYEEAEIVKNQTVMQEAIEQANIVPFEPVSCKQTED